MYLYEQILDGSSFIDKGFSDLFPAIMELSEAHKEFANCYRDPISKALKIRT
jgi:hypothetical protein